MLMLEDKKLQGVTLGEYKEFNIEDLKEQMKFVPEVQSWKTMHYANYRNKFLTFTVRARKFEGRVWIGINGSDLFDTFFTDEAGVVKDQTPSIHYNDLIQEINFFIEGRYTA